MTSKYTTLEASQDELAKAVDRVLELNLFPLVLGGGHETAFGHYKGISTFLDDREDNKLGILNFDAHFDLRPYEKGTGTSGTMFRQIADYTREKGTQYAYYVMGCLLYTSDAADDLLTV